MIIGIDAGALSISDDRLKVGVWRYTFEVIRALSHRNRGEYVFRLYSFAPIPRSVMHEFGTGVTNVVLAPSTGFMTLRLPIELRLRPVEVFLGLSQAIPHVHTCMRIGMVHDAEVCKNPRLYGNSASTLFSNTKFILCNADRIIVPSDYVRNTLIGFDLRAPERISVIPEGVSDIFKPTGIRKTSDRPYFLFVGSLRTGKNLPLLISAFELFCQMKKKPYDLLLVGGDYWPDPLITRMVNKSPVKEHIRLLGHVSDVLLAQYYRGAVAFITPSSSEGFCLPAAEAMRSGCPVIAPEVGPFPEVVGSAGLLVRSYTPEGFARAMKRISAGVRTRKTLVKRGFAKSKSHSWTHVAEAIASFFIPL